MSCGICSGEFRVGCHWDATYTFGACCDTAAGATGDANCWFGTTQYDLCCDGWSPAALPPPPPPPPPPIPTDCTGLADGTVCDDLVASTDSDVCTSEVCAGTPAKWWCADQPDFRDEGGFGCADWADPSFDCVADSATYTPGGREALYAGCAASCGLCQDWRGYSGCWAGDSTYTRCCDTSTSPTGDNSCWGGGFDFDSCQCAEPDEPVCAADNLYVAVAHGAEVAFWLGATACSYGPTHGQPGYAQPVYGRCVAQDLWGNGWCDDASNSPNGPTFNPLVPAYDMWHADLNCEAAGFDGGDCLTGDDDPCPTHGDVLGCDGLCYPIPDPPATSPLGDGICDPRFNCEARQFDRGDCALASPCSLDYSSWVDCSGNCQDYMFSDGVCDTDTNLFGNFACPELGNDDGDCLFDCTGQEAGSNCNDGDVLTVNDVCQEDGSCVGEVPGPCHFQSEACFADFDCLLALATEDDPATRVDEMLVAVLNNPLGNAFMCKSQAAPIGAWRLSRAH